MNSSAVLTALKQLTSQLAAVLKETVRLPYARVYLLLSVIFTIFFSLIMFPVEILINSQLQNLEKSAFVQITSENLDVNYLTDSTVDQFNVMFKDGDELRLTDVTLDLNLMGLMLRHLLKLDYHPDGSLAVQKLQYETEDITIRGSLNASVDLVIQRPDSRIKEGDLSLLLQNALIKIKSFTLPEQMGGLDIELPPIQCPSLNIEAAVSENSIQFKKCNISGTDLRGVLSGSIARSRMMKNSTLNLSLTVDEGSTILDKYKMLLGKYINNGKLAIQIKGTVGRPTLTFAQ